MSLPDPPAPDLGALDAATRQRLENVRYPQRAMAMDVRTILAAYDALAARLAAVEGERNHYCKRLDELTDDSLLDGLPDTDLERYGQSSPQEIYRWLLDAEARLAAARDALVVLYELNEAGNVGGAVYEEAMDLAMDVLRDTETAPGAVGAGEA